MSPIIQTLANASALGYRSLSAAAAADTGAMFPLQVITVGAAGASSVTFTNIPNTYEHLQLRYITRNNVGAYYVRLQFNNDTTAANYSYHELNGNGSAVSASGGASSQYIYLPRNTDSGSSIFGAGVVDILDYKNTNKNKTVRAVGGYDANGSGVVDFTSGGYYQTTAISSIQLTVLAGSYQQYSQFALYGVKGA